MRSREKKGNFRWAIKERKLSERKTAKKLFVLKFSQFSSKSQSLKFSCEFLVARFSSGAFSWLFLVHATPNRSCDKNSKKMKSIKVNQRFAIRSWLWSFSSVFCFAISCVKIAPRSFFEFSASSLLIFPSRFRFEFNSLQHKSFVIKIKIAAKPKKKSREV